MTVSWHTRDPALPFEGETPLDAGIRAYVLALRDGGVETFESCEGSPSHAFTEPTVRFYGNEAAGYRAFAVALDAGLPVAVLRRYHYVDACVLHGPYWEMTFRLPKES